MKIEIISELTTHRPLYNMGMVAGVCYDSDTESEQANIKRALECIKHKHERVLEIPEICVKISGISAKSLREIYTHIGGLPTRLQASTRFIDYECFDYIIPHSVINTDGAKEISGQTVQILLELPVVTDDNEIKYVKIPLCEADILDVFNFKFANVKQDVMKFQDDLIKL